METLDILAIEPYMAGSHRSFLEGLQAHSRHRLQVWGMPGRKWKWRMRGAAINFARQLEELDAVPDLFLVSDYLDVATFRGLMPSRFRDVPILTYFHENQLTYPVQEESERDYQFAFTNITTCLASDWVLFNSDYHRESFLAAVSPFLQRMPDYVPQGVSEAIRSKSGVQHLGVEVPDFGGEMDGAGAAGDSGHGLTSKPWHRGEPGAAGDSHGLTSKPWHRGQPSKSRTVAWNHRWEYDKNPDLFFRTLFELDESGVEFGLIVLGERFRQSPAVFEEAQERLARKIVHFGYAEDRRHYWQLLRQADIVVSTAIHEFFGLAVVEGIAAGCFPLLPYRLAYPELLPQSLHADCLYRTDGEFRERLAGLLAGPLPPVREQLQAVSRRFHWSERAGDYDREFVGLVGKSRKGCAGGQT